MTVGRLKKEMTMREYMDWIAFYQMQSEDPDKPNMLNSEQDMLKGFGLG